MRAVLLAGLFLIACTPPGSAPTSSTVATGSTPSTCGSKAVTTANLDPECGLCAEGFCCAEGDACDANADCPSLVTCLQACTDSTCGDACVAQHPAGKDAAQAFLRCGHDKCDVHCSATPLPSSRSCGAAAALPTVFPKITATCDACMRASCCEEGDRCDGDVGCVSQLACAATCGSDEGCLDECMTEYPDPNETAKAFMTCSLAKCDTECR